jgi:type IV secretion system protein TrbE
MGNFYIFLIAITLIVLVNFFLNYREKDFITPQKKDKSQSFSELLNYTALVDDGIILTTQGTLIAGFFFQGDDIQAFTKEELEGRSTILNDTIKNLGDNCIIQVDAIRTPATQYPSKAKRFFSDPVTKKIDNIRREMFERGSHSETTYALLITYVPPKIREKKVTDLMYDNPEGNKEESPFTKNLNIFKEKLYILEQNLKSVLRLDKMHSIMSENEFAQTLHTDELVNYINYCLTAQYIRINIPKNPMNITSLLGVESFEPGLISVLGNKNIVTVSVNGYPIESTPAILNALDKLPCEYRLSHRFITLPRELAVSIAKKQQRKWQQKIRGMRDQFANTTKGPINQDAISMTEEAGLAYSEIESGLVAYGFHSCTVILMDNNQDNLFENATLVQRVLAQAGFTSCVEDINTTEAFLGSLPGNILNNIRQMPISTMVLADILPTTSIWAGLENCPHPEFPPNTPSLMHASTEGITPFRFNLHVGDVGHTLIFGPTGAGKSTLIGLILAQFRAFQNAKIYAFDKGYSLYALTKGIKGDHYDLAGKSSQLQFSPLQDIDTSHDFQWAVDWISTLIQLQIKRDVAPKETAEIIDAMKLLRNSDMRTLTDFKVLLQNTDLRTCIEIYTDGVVGEMIDNEQDNLSLSDFSVFELEHLMKLDEKYMLPVLLYIFHRIENTLNGDPSILSLDEGWIALGNDTFRDKLKEWLKVLRKRNCSVVFATQSISDASNSGIIDVLDESCFTKVFLPNSSAKNETSARHYINLGINSAELNIISTAIPKRDYYIVQRGQGKRLINFNLDPYTLAFVGRAGEHIKDNLDQLILKHPENWRDVWINS